MSQCEQKSRVRVLEVSGRAAGGVRTHLLQCARVLAGMGHDVIVEAPASVLDGADDLLGQARAESLEIGARPSPSDAVVLVRLRRLGRQADVVHAHGLRAGALAGLALGSLRCRRRRGGPRLVVTLHNLPVGSAVVRATGRWLESVVARRADAVLVVSPDLAERMRAAGAAQVTVAVVPAPEWPAGGTTQPAQARGEELPGVGRECGLVSDPWPAGSARLVTVARLARQKGLDLLLDAATLVARQTDRPVSWVVAGEGPERGRLQARITEENLPVVLMGRSQEVSELMRRADVVVQTSLWEGQPLTIQEALRAGAALVATDVGGTALTARGAAVLVCPQAPALAEAVLGLLSDDQALARARLRSRAASAGLPGQAELAAQLRQVLFAGQ